ncbi:MAG: hypothetical protein AVDCRST_MAG35-1510, partial [uncultured Quadrisphaera sp.]
SATCCWPCSTRAGPGWRWSTPRSRRPGAWPRCATPAGRPAPPPPGASGSPPRCWPRWARPCRWPGAPSPPCA